MIFYFSGTGNSLQVAKALAENDKLLNISTTVPSTFTDKSIGFVFPVYCGVIPPFVENFIEKSTFNCEYIWMVATCGGSEGKSFNHLQNILMKQGRRLSYANHIVMPDNCIIFKTSPKDRENQFNFLNDTLEKIKNDISTKKEIAISPKFSKKSSQLMWWGMRAFLGIDKKQANNLCDGCKVCVNICPTNNIKYENNKIIFGDDCAYCFACIHWCHKEAIKFGRLKVDEKTSYKNPTVSVKEMIENNKKPQ